ncbi:MAG: hypothetical protein ACRCYO_19455, partial [Bacteroidia bacterium]
LYKVPPTWKAEDYNPYFNAAENQGAFAGIQYTLDGKKNISWLRNQEWNAIQAYGSDDSPIVITRYKNESLGIDVVCTDWVEPTKDVLRRMFYVTNRGTKNVSELMLVHVANVAPCNVTPEFDPGADWADDQKNGFAVAYDSVQEAFVAFRPNLKEQIAGRIPHANASGKQVQVFAENLDQNFPSTLSANSSVMQTTDVYCAIGSISSPVAYSLFEDNGTNPNLPDLIVGNKKRIGRGPCLVSQSYPLSDKRTTAVTMLFSFGAKATTCMNLLKDAKQKTAETSMQETGMFWGARMQKAKVPDTKDVGMKKTLQRTLINILLSTNRDAGGISSSAGTTQPPYAMIWPRDAAMMGFVLDCAGFHEEAERNSLFFVSTQRQKEGEQCYKPPADDCYKGTWFQCYYANGKPSWMYNFEIDEVGFSIWMFYNHALFLEGEKQKVYLRKVYPSIKLAADFLTTFKDPQTGLQPRAREDDLMWKSQTTLGAGATLVGLKSAIAAAKLLNENPDDVQRWTKRREELEPAILKYFWKEKTNQFESSVYGNFGPRGVILWPAMYFPASDSRADGHAQAIYKQVVPFFEKQDQALNKEWWYLGKTTLAMAYAWRNN